MRNSRDLSALGAPVCVLSQAHQVPAPRDGRVTITAASFRWEVQYGPQIVGKQHTPPRNTSMVSFQGKKSRYECRQTLLHHPPPLTEQAWACPFFRLKIYLFHFSSLITEPSTSLVPSQPTWFTAVDLSANTLKSSYLLNLLNLLN